MSFNTTQQQDSPKQQDSPDWRNTLYQFHDAAVPKYELRSQEIAMYSALLSKVKNTGLIKMGNAELMEKSGIANKTAFWRARNRLVEAGIIEIVKLGNVFKECTLYKIKLVGRPKHIKRNNDNQSDVSN